MPKEMERKNKFKVLVAFGALSARYAEEHGFDAIDTQEDEEINYILKVFYSEAERNAYLEGLSDMQGWFEYYSLKV